ncbi:11880_t:CDS:2 [Ambispora gerdemannii]|uniref:11880_t:CDS:1 n=1 Tax=Ambispora gerdemannii TaxID=144530 RepID=A0A9N9GUS5_9GLOM|nr:11880_t:CDS:2 [Ambispora gerdemannii]
MSNFLLTFSTDICQLLTDSEEYNVLIEAGDKSEGDFKVFYAHSIILRARCSYFKTGLSNEWARKEGQVTIFQKPNISPKVFNIILNGTIALENEDIPTILNLLVAADELLINEISDFVQDHLLEHESAWLKSNLVLLWSKIHPYSSCKKLQERCLALICKDPLVLFGSQDFLHLDESLLVPFLKLDNLQMEEVELWDFMLKWGLAKNPRIGSDVCSWTKEDFRDMEATLRECIPLIDFEHISSRHFYDHVWPYRDLIPELTIEQIIRYNFKPEIYPQGVTLARRLQFDSCLIRPIHAAILASWIDRLGQRRYLHEEIPYRLQLLLRGTRDGFDSNTFHKLCDDHSRTVVIMRIKGSDEIIGGYSPTRWMTNEGYWNTEDSFLFSFGSRGAIEDARLSRVSKSRSYYAIRLNGSEHGPCFGDKDLTMRGKFDEEGSCSCQKDDYTESVTIVGSFAVNEYEVFHVVRK